MFFIGQSAFSQEEEEPVRKKPGVSAIRIQYGAFQAGADLADRFGASSSLGIGFSRKSASNWVWGFDLNYHFGNQFKEQYIFDDLTTFRGNFITIDGGYGDVRFFQRGISSYFSVGKVIPVFGRNKNSGIFINGGLGFLEHQIYIEVIEDNVQALKDPYHKGYDRRTNGMSLHEFVGYWYMHPNRRINFFAGFEFSQSFTQNRRDWDFYLQRKMDEKRKDYLNGIKIGLLIPIKRKEPKEFYLN